MVFKLLHEEESPYTTIIIQAASCLLACWLLNPVARPGD